MIPNNFAMAVLVGMIFLVVGSGMAFGTIVGGYVALAIGVIYVAAAYLDF